MGRHCGLHLAFITRSSTVRSANEADRRSVRSLNVSPSCSSATNGLLGAPDVRARADSASAHSQQSGARISLSIGPGASGSASGNARALGAYCLYLFCFTYAQLWILITITCQVAAELCGWSSCAPSWQLCSSLRPIRQQNFVNLFVCFRTVVLKRTNKLTNTVLVFIISAVTLQST